MNKQEFLEKLKNGLCGLPSQDIDERLSFYSEMIDDRVEEGLTEEDAVAELGNIEEITSQILNDIPLTKIIKDKMKKKIDLPIWVIVLIIIGSPIWASILGSLLSAVISIYISFWVCIISLWAVTIALGASTFALLVCGIITIIKGNVLSGIVMLSVACIASGLSIFFDYGCKWASKGIVLLTKKIGLWIKKLFIKREDA
ncbi:MAG: DUF1700 domain-containing protein [Clostridia bacterium]|nr:DUF1700 domain-containing protein [Clostridia bacterium]